MVGMRSPFLSRARRETGVHKHARLLNNEAIESKGQAPTSQPTKEANFPTLKPEIHPLSYPPF